MEQESVDCALCEVDDAREFLRASDPRFLGTEEFRIVKCRRCGLVYVNPRPTLAQQGAYYPDEYWDAPTPEGAKPRIDPPLRWVLDFLERTHPGGRVLDVGCGPGMKTAAMRDRGLRPIGLEPSDTARTVAREHYGLEVLSGFLSEADLPDSSFDAITFFDVVEHLHDPLGDLRKAKALLKPGGSIVVRVPNFESLQAKVLGRWWWALDVPRHLYHFSPTTLRLALEKAGFAQVRCRALREPWRDGLEASIVFWLRGASWARKGVQVVPDAGQSAEEALEGKVYPSVPSAGKSAFRWAARNLLYPPFLLENLIGRGVALVGTAEK